MKFEVTILGSSSATPVFNRHPTSQLLNVHDTFILIDCGEATQMQLVRYGIKPSKIQYILISHLHGDHYLGLIGLLSSLNLNGRKEEIFLYGPKGLDELLKLHFHLSHTELKYPLHFHETHHIQECIIDAKSFTVETIPLQHSVQCTGFKISEKHRGFKLRKEKITEYDIPLEKLNGIKEGADFLRADGLSVPNAELTELPAPLRSYAFFSDTKYLPEIADSIRGVSTLYHEATFTAEMTERALFTFHSTAGQAAMMAVNAGIENLLLGHFSARYRDLNPILEEALQIFPSSRLALEGLTFQI